MPSACWMSQLMLALAIPVTLGLPVCLDSQYTNYFQCTSGNTKPVFSRCINDEDFSDLAACFDTIGRSAITDVYLSYNTFTYVPEDLFTGMSSLENLSFHYGKLTTLPAKIFAGLTKLKELDFTFNQLTTLPDGVFAEATALETLYLGQNTVLQCLPATTATEVNLWEEYIADGTCGCTPVEDVSCDEGLTCSPGADGYACDAGGIQYASEVTDVNTWSNAYDTKPLSEGGCTTTGCYAQLTRDNDLQESSRWSCQYALQNTECLLWYGFSAPQDVINMEVAFYKGDERTRSFSVTTVNQNDQSTVTYEFTSGGTTTDYESFELNSDSTYRLYVTPTGDNYYDWLSITEVRFQV